MTDQQPPFDPRSDLLGFTFEQGDNFELIVKPKPGERVVRVDTDHSRELRDLVGICFDLRRVAEICDRYIQAMDADEAELIQDSLWMTAVMLYARCFNDGVRSRLSTDLLDTMEGQAREAHDHFIDLRNKFIAHSVNAYEQTLAHAVIDAKTGELKHSGTAHLWANAMNRDGALTLKRLAREFLGVASYQQWMTNLAVGAEIDELGPEGLLGLRDLATEVPNVERGKRRRK
ncbi:hypothetical protein [Pseudolysinimonas sp.]|jgi:hypothetical protein|uniref:hypothetical protein n=1 Tax=Pseudolysinimonas sp. TaxID=2680009 RepID=UPI00378517E4